MKTSPFLASLLLLPYVVSPACAIQEPDKTEPSKASKPAKLAQLTIGGEISEGPEAAGGATMFSFGPKPKRLQSVLKSIRKAKDDAEVSGLLLRVEDPQAGMGKMSAIRKALLDFKSSGKKIHMHCSEASTKEYLLACAADDISMVPAGWLMLPGLRIEMTYMKELLDWAGIQADVIHIGEFKTAYENFYRSEMSQGQKEAYGAILDGFFEEIVGGIAEGRKMTPERVKAAIDTGIFPAAQARARGLIDQVEYEDEFRARLRKEYGETLEILENYGKPPREDIDFTDFTFFIKIFSEMSKKPTKPKGDKIAVVYAVGAINSGKSQDSPMGGQTMGSATMVKAIREAAEDASVKAIVLRVDSPGGSGLASDEIWREVVRAKEKKPFVVSMSDVAASGGYYIAMAADSIVAEPNTITGSIGVIGMKLVMQGLYQKVGVKPQVIQRGKIAGMFSSAQAFTSEERTLMTKLMESFYSDFVSKVSDGRKRAFEEMEKIARGRIWTGKQAKQLGLVDEVGGLDDAIRIAKTKAGIDPAKELNLIELPRPKTFMELLEEEDLPFLRMSGENSPLGAFLADPLLRRAYQQADLLLRLQDRVFCLLPVDISWN